MIECWLTVQVDAQRTADIRVSGESLAKIEQDNKEKDGLKVIAVRPCHKLEKPMAEATFSDSFLEFLTALKNLNIKPPASIELANREEAIKVILEIKEKESIISPACYNSSVRKIESGEMERFLLFGIEFWWRPSLVAVKAQEGLKAVA